MAENAAGVRSIIRPLPQVPPQQFWPQNDCVRGPQSRTTTRVHCPLHRLTSSFICRVCA